MSDDAVKAAAEALKDPLVLGEGWEVLVGLTDRERQVAASAVVERVRPHVEADATAEYERDWQEHAHSLETERDAARAEAARCRAALENALGWLQRIAEHGSGPCCEHAADPPCRLQQAIDRARTALDGEERR